MKITMKNTNKTLQMSKRKTITMLLLERILVLEKIFISGLSKSTTTTA